MNSNETLKNYNTVLRMYGHCAL